MNIDRPTLDERCVNTIRTLSAGHASMLLYSVLHLCGVEATSPTYAQGDRLAVTLDDIKTFRQAGIRCTGHPEYGWTSGVETTTGPLGQGLATSVGLAMAERWLAATYNRPGYDLFDYRVYALCGDGDMMEGISSEAASLAGHLELSNLCWVYDDNHITIEGPTGITFTEDVAARFLGYGWHVVRVSDANDLELLARGCQTFLDTRDRPTLVIVQSHIGYGAPHKQDTRQAHGEPLGPEEVRLAKQFYGWNPDAQFHIPDGVTAHFEEQLGRRGASARAAWQAVCAAYRQQYPDLADQIDRMQHRDLPEGWDSALPTFSADAKGLATRDSSAEHAMRDRQRGESVASFRAMPGMIVLRPADANEVVEAWRVIMDIKDRPVSLVLTRQALPTVDRTKYTPANGVARGAYVLADAPDHAPDVLLLATGSEVSLCITAYEQLTSDGIKARVAVEEASTFGWERYAGVSGTMLGLHTFGLSAPMKVVAPHFGCDSAHVVAAAREQGARHAAGRRTSGAGGI